MGSDEGCRCGVTDQPEIRARKFVDYVPVAILGTDEQGRLTYTCPNAGCGETGHVEPDGEMVCPQCTPYRLALEQMMRDAMRRMGDE